MKLITIISFFIALNLSPSISEIRKLYKEASVSEAATQKMFSKLEQITIRDNYVLLAYKAAAYTLKAKHIKGIKNKKRYFKDGATLLEGLISKHPEDLELRFIRFTIQENSPKIVGYKKNIETDKAFIINNMPKNNDKELKAIIKAYVSKSKSFSTAEKNVFSEL